MSKRNIDIMLDLEFFATEEDIMVEFLGQGKTPLVTSIGMVVRDRDTKKVIVHSLIPLPMQEQLDKGAVMTIRCMDFWHKEPLFGKEFFKSLNQNNSMEECLDNVADLINRVKQEGKVRLIGNNLLADNSKLVQLFCKYGTTNTTPNIEYWDHFDFQGMKRLAREYFQVDIKAIETQFEKAVLNGEVPGYTEVSTHDPVYDCLKQFYVMDALDNFFKNVKEEVNAKSNLNTN